MTKDFAKASSIHPDSPLPRDVARLLYFASIVVALLRCGEHISELNEESLRDGVASLIDQPWVNEQIRSLFREGMAYFNQRTGKD